MSRPFILARDASQYDTTSVPQQGIGAVRADACAGSLRPWGRLNSSASVKFKPAPTDANVTISSNPASPTGRACLTATPTAKFRSGRPKSKGSRRQVKGKYIFFRSAGACVRPL